MISYIIYLDSMLCIDTHRDTYPGEDPGGRLAASRKGVVEGVWLVSLVSYT